MKQAFKSVENKDVSHLLVLQDDILPCKDFIKTVKKTIELLPNEVISYFTAYDTSKPLSVGKHWSTIDRLYGLCAYVIPVFLIDQYLEFDKKIKDRIFADDVRLSMFLQSIDRKAYLTAPSLVEHICWDRTSQRDNRVPLDNAINFRIARNYIGFEESGLEIDWTKGLKDTHAIKIGQKHDYIRHLKTGSDNID
jgi:hypothetical protein